MRRIIVCCALVVVAASAGCASKPTAAQVCAKLVESGVAANCKEDKPSGLGAAASEKMSFDLPSVPGKTGQVMRFDNEQAYTTTETAFTNAAALAGPHRYGSKKALIFVQANDKASLDDGKKMKAVVDAL